jgi:hypothetical protein
MGAERRRALLCAEGIGGGMSIQQVKFDGQGVRPDRTVRRQAARRRGCSGAAVVPGRDRGRGRRRAIGSSVRDSRRAFRRSPDGHGRWLVGLADRTETESWEPYKPPWSTARPCMCSTSSRCGCPPRTRFRRRWPPRWRLGEALGASGAKILTAMVLGIEIQVRLRAAAGDLANPMSSASIRPDLLGRSARPLPAGHLLDFDAAQFANAIGIAGSRCGGLFVNLGTMTKATHCGYAASPWAWSPLCSTRRGFTGCPTLFDPLRRAMPRRSSLTAS